MRTSITLGAVALTLTALLSGCRSAPDDELQRPTVTRTVTAIPGIGRLPDLPTAGSPKPTTAAWAAGGRLHVGSTIVTLSPLHVDAFALTLGGVYLLSSRGLWATDLTRAHDTGIRRVDALSVSPDGRYLGFVDLPDGKRGATSLATVDVYDTATGRPLVHSAAGMGDPRKDDLASLYAKAAPTALGFATDGRFLASTPAGTYAYPLGGGHPTKLAGDAFGATQAGTPVGVRRTGTRYALLPKPSDGAEALLGPGHRYGVVADTHQVFRVFDARTGMVLTIAGAPRFLVPGTWTSPTTFRGLALRQASGAPVGLVRCDLAARTCTTEVPGARLRPDPVVLPTGVPPGN